MMILLQRMLKNSNIKAWFFHARDPSVKQKNHLYEQAKKAMYGIIRKIREFKLP